MISPAQLPRLTNTSPTPKYGQPSSTNKSRRFYKGSIVCVSKLPKLNTLCSTNPLVCTCGSIGFANNGAAVTAAAGLTAAAGVVAPVAPMPPRLRADSSEEAVAVVGTTGGATAGVSAGAGVGVRGSDREDGWVVWGGPYE